MPTIQLNGTVRQATGKGGARQARFAGQIPGVIYGAGENPVSLQIAARDLDKALAKRAGGNLMVQLMISGATPPERMSIIREVQRDPITGRAKHIDFQHVDMAKKITLKVHVVTHGIPGGVKMGGGILEHMVREIEIRCLPGDIPERVSVDVSALEIGDAIKVKDLVLGNVELLSEPDAVIATVVPPTVMEEIKPAEGAAAAEPELIGKKPATEAEAGADKDKEKDKSKEKDKKK